MDADGTTIELGYQQQRAAVYDTARQMASCLRDRDVSRWATPIRDTTSVDLGL